MEELEKGVESNITAPDRNSNNRALTNSSAELTFVSVGSRDKNFRSIT